MNDFGRDTTGGDWTKLKPNLKTHEERREEASFAAPAAHAPEPGRPTAQRPVSLVAVMTPEGPKVTRMVVENGKAHKLHEFRRPTPDEYNAIMSQGKAVSAGTALAPQNTSTGRDKGFLPLGGVNVVKACVRCTVALALLGALGYGGWYGYQRFVKPRLEEDSD